MKITDSTFWEAFHWVAKEKSFTRAAEAMRVGVPLLSKKIARLEEELGTRLFHRSTRKVSLTDEGLGLLPQVVSVLEDLRGLETRFERKDTLSGTIRITSAPALGHRLIGPLLIEFMQLYPQIRIELDLTDQLVDLIGDQMDIGIRIHKPAATELIYRKLATNEMILCASPGYLKSAKAPLRRPEDLAKHPLLVTDHVDSELKFRRGGLRLRDVSVAQRFRCESGILLTEFAVGGAGVAVRPLWDAYPSIQAGKLVRVLEKYPLESFGDIYAVIPSRRFLAYRVRTFMDFLLDRVAKLPFQSAIPKAGDQ